MSPTNCSKNVSGVLTYIRIDLCEVAHTACMNGMFSGIT